MLLKYFKSTLLKGAGDRPINPAIQGMRQKELQVQSWPGLQSNFKATVDNVDLAYNRKVTGLGSQVEYCVT